MDGFELIFECDDLFLEVAEDIGPLIHFNNKIIMVLFLFFKLYFCFSLYFAIG
jgi:hypothetical protein